MSEGHGGGHAKAEEGGEEQGGNDGAEAAKHAAMLAAMQKKANEGPGYSVAHGTFFDIQRRIWLKPTRQKKGVKSVAYVGEIRAAHLDPKSKIYKPDYPVMGGPEKNEVTLARVVEELVNNPQHTGIRTSIGSVLAQRGQAFDWHGDLAPFFDTLKTQAFLAAHRGFNPNNPWHQVLQLISKHHQDPHEPKPHDETPAPEPTKPSEPGETPAEKEPSSTPSPGSESRNGLSGAPRPGRRTGADPASLGDAAGRSIFRRRLPPAVEQRLRRRALGASGFMPPGAASESGPRRLFASRSGTPGVSGYPSFIRVTSPDSRSGSSSGVSEPAAAASMSGAESPAKLLQAVLAHSTFLESPQARARIGRELDQLHSKDRQVGFDFGFFGFHPDYTGETDKRPYKTFEKALQNVQNFNQVVERLKGTMSREQQEHLHAALLRGILRHHAGQGPAHANWVAGQFNDLATDGHLRFETGGLRKAQEELRSGNVRAVQDRMVTERGRPTRELLYGIQSIRPTSGAIPSNSHEFITRHLLSGLRRRLG